MILTADAFWLNADIWPDEVSEEDIDESTACVFEKIIYKFLDDLEDSTCSPWSRKEFLGCTEELFKTEVAKMGFGCYNAWWKAFFPAGSRECTVEDKDEIVKFRFEIGHKLTSVFCLPQNLMPHTRDVTQNPPLCCHSP